MSITSTTTFNFLCVANFKDSKTFFSFLSNCTSSNAIEHFLVQQKMAQTSGLVAYALFLAKLREKATSIPTHNSGKKDTKSSSSSSFLHTTTISALKRLAVMETPRGNATFKMKGASNTT